LNITIFTDGASRGNPGPGGWGAVMIYKNIKKEFSAGYRLTTNNRMELLAVIESLKKLKKNGFNIDIYSDSSYVVNAIEKKWVWGWAQKNFKDKKNEDLWREFLKLYPLNNIKMHWVKGHADNPYNNRCDYLATHAALNNPTLIDTEFEKIHQQQ